MMENELLNKQSELVAQANEYIASGQNMVEPRYFDNHMIKEYCEEPLKYLIKFVWGLRPNEDNRTLEFGKAVHSALDVWWTEHDEQAMLDKFQTELPEKYWVNEYDQRNLQGGQRMLSRYHRTWIENSRFELMEGTCEIVFVIPIDATHYYIISLDKMLYDTENDHRITPCDHKTSSRNEFEKLIYDRQFIGYVWALRQLGFNCNNLLIDGIVIAQNDLTLRRVVTPPYSEGLLNAFGAELSAKVQHIEYDIKYNTWSPNRCNWLMQSPSMQWANELINELEPKMWRAWVESNGWLKQIWNPIDKLGCEE